MFEKKYGISTRYPDDMIGCDICHLRDYRTAIAHLCMCNYQEGIASQAVVECIEDTHAQLPQEVWEAKIALRAYDRNCIGMAVSEIAQQWCIPLPVFLAWRLQWLRRLAVALEDAELLDLNRPLLLDRFYDQQEGDGCRISDKGLSADAPSEYDKSTAY